MEGTVFQTASDFITKWLPVLISIVGTFALIATITPNKSDDKIVQVLYDLINFFGGNIGQAKNAGKVLPPAPKPEGE